MTNSISITDDGAQSISSDERSLAYYQSMRNTILTTGQEYSIQGSRTVKLPPLEYVERMIRLYEARVLRARGRIPRNLPDFSTSTSTDNIPAES